MEGPKRARAASLARSGGSAGGESPAPDKAAPATRALAAPGAGALRAPTHGENGASVLELPGSGAAAGAPLPPPAGAPLPPLPDSVVLQIFALLSVEERLRGREVSRAWREALRAPSLWRHVDLRFPSDWPPQRCHLVVHQLVQLTAGGMHTLRMDLPRIEFADPMVDLDVITRASSGLLGLQLQKLLVGSTLRMVDLTYHDLSLQDLKRLLERCPALNTIRLGALRGRLEQAADVQELAAALSGDGQYKHVTVCALEVVCTYAGNLSVLLAAMERNRSVRKLTLFCIENDEGASALAFAAARAGVVDFTFERVDDPHSFTEQVAQLLSGFPVQQLCFVFNRYDWDSTCSMPFAEALRNHRSLLTLTLQRAELGSSAVIALLKGHPTLTRLSFKSCVVKHAHLQAPVARLLARLLSEPSALTDLSLAGMKLGEQSLNILLPGLASPDARLQSLDLSECPIVTPHYAARVIGPAVLACASMRELHLAKDGPLHAVQCRINELLQVQAQEDGVAR